jgi:tRNA(fMet)-specific endonuclease VapC
MVYILDTNIVVMMVRGLKVFARTNERQRERHKAAYRILRRARNHKISGDNVAISAITVAELEFGSWNSTDYESESDAARRAIAPFEFLAFDAVDCAMQYGRVRHSLESAGTPIGSLDTLIAAHALAVGATLITSDTLEFSRVPGLRCENWAL